eukprot:CAMPEP_0118953634 /NCGR_PEP_ID=MMETSP1169-20130426/56911_1 /TAXON_ID=36882 /ORGANISM="Pyramimonas obovata, Strain CCMP722" /LENGTH=244 /DNA_ID=CAMNT_0006901143 /DNA_START=103 /DNA_END=833 /DNA_ORIENTATION=+
MQNVNAPTFVPTAQPFVPASSIASAVNAAPFVPSFSQSSGAVSISAPEFVPGQRGSVNVNAVPFNPTGTNVGAAPFVPPDQQAQYEEEEEDEYDEGEEEEEGYAPEAQQFVLPEEDDLSLGFHASTPDPPIRPPRPTRSGPISPAALGMQSGVEMQGGALFLYDPAQHMTTMHVSQQPSRVVKPGQLLMASRFMPEDLRAELQQRSYLEASTEPFVNDEHMIELPEMIGDYHSLVYLEETPESG